MKVTLSTNVAETPKVMQLRGMFDVPKRDRETLEIEVPTEVEAVSQDRAERDWSIGLIVGPSGAGKSSVARALWPDDVGDPFWHQDRSIVDHFEDCGVKQATSYLTSVGLGSPPAWLRPYSTLSTGERFRADMARLLATERDPIVVDEFTSTVDRQVAKVASHAVQKSVRRAGRRLVAVTCHFDVIDWLQPDWVYRPDTVDFEWRRLQRHPPLELVFTALPKSAWAGFARHHYLSHVLHAAAHCYGAWIGDQCVAFNCHIPFPHPTTKNIRMGHRLVVLPDYQGLGIGLIFDNWLGEHLAAKGYRYHKTISHPALIHALAKSPRWKMHKQGANRPTRGGAKRLRKTMSQSRKLSTRSFHYIPEKKT